MAQDLTAKAGLNTSNFSEGVLKLKSELATLNTAYEQTKQETAEVNKEVKELTKKQKELATEMEKGGGTKEQKQQMQELADKLSQANARLGQLKATEAELKVDIKTTTNALTKQKQSTDEVASSSKTASANITGFATALKTIIAGYTGKKLYEALIGSNAEMEQYSKSFEVMLGDAQKASDMMKSLQDFAATTPLELTDVVSTGTLLMNYGVDESSLIDTMTKLGDLSSGNADKLNRVSLAYGQMLAKGKVSGEELRQMTEAGIPLLATLAVTMGKSTEEVQKLVSAGQVGIPELNGAIDSLTTGTGKFAGMMEEQSKTFSGMISTLSDEATQFGRDVGEGAFEVAKDSLSELLELIEQWRNDGTLEEMAKELGTTIENVVSVLKSAVGFIWENKEAIGALAIGIGVFKAASVVNNAVMKIANKLLMEGATAEAAKAAATVSSTTATTASTVAITANNAAKTSSISLSTLAAGATAKMTTAAAGLGAMASSTSFQLGALGVVVTAVIAEFVAFGKVIFDVSDSVKEMQQATQEARDIIDEDTASSKAENAILTEKVKRYDELRAAANLTAEEHEQLTTLAGELQETFGDEVDVIDKLTGSYSNLSGALDNYIEKQSAKVKLSNYEDAAKQAYENIDNIDKAMEKRKQDYQNQQNGLFSWYTQNLDQTSFINDMAAYRAEIDKNQEIIDEYEAELRGLSTTETDVAESTRQMGDSKSDAAKRTQALADALGEEKTTLDELKESTQSMVSENNSLYDSLANIKSGQAISYEQMQKLAQIYPEILNHITLTADGYIIETGAVDGLSLALSDNVNGQIEAEKEKTQAAIDGARERIEIYKSEMSAYAQNGESTKAKAIKEALDEEYAYLGEMETKLSTDNTLTGYFEKALGRTTGNSSKKTATKSEENEALYDEEKKFLDYKLNMGEQTEEEYYKELTKLRDKYLEENSDKWRAATLAIHKFGLETEKDSYTSANKEYELFIKEKQKLINKELSAKEKLRDETIAAIDAEVEARKRLTEDNDIQSEIDAVTAQLKYAQLDDFSRLQLERKLGNLQTQQSDLAWERSVTDRKEKANAEYDEATTAADETKEMLSAAVSTVKEILTELATGVTNISNVVNTAITNNNTTNNSPTINLGNQSYTPEQLITIVNKFYGIVV